MFSELVDEVCVMIGRSNARTKQNVIKYARLTMRECQMLDYFHNDLVENTITASAEPHSWDKPDNLRELRTVRYSARYDDGRWPKLIRPGKVQNDEDFYYYAGTNYYVFAGVSIGNNIDLAYYLYFPYLKYYETASERPAVFDREAGTWTYHATYDVSDEKRTEARDLVSNWLLKDWAELIQEGVLAKTYKMLREDRMASTSFSLYKSFQNALRTGETSESYGV